MYSKGLDFDLQLSGFDQLKRVLDPNRFDRALKKYMAQENKRSGVLGRQLVKKSIRSQQWVPNSPWTIRRKGHNKTLIHWEIMLRSANYTIIPWGFIVGVHKVSDDGKYNVAQIVHDGAVAKHPQTKRPLVIPARPFFSRALTNKDSIPAMYSAKVKDSLFLRMVSLHWQMAVHKAFTERLKPTSKKRPT